MFQSVQPDPASPIHVSIWAASSPASSALLPMAGGRSLLKGQNVYIYIYMAKVEMSVPGGQVQAGPESLAWTALGGCVGRGEESVGGSFLSLWTPGGKGVQPGGRGCRLRPPGACVCVQGPPRNAGP